MANGIGSAEVGTTKGKGVQLGSASKWNKQQPPTGDRKSTISSLRCLLILNTSNVSQMRKDEHCICRHNEKKLDDETIKLLETLSLVNFESKEHIQVVEDAINFASKIQSVNTDNVEPLISVLENETLKLREDKVIEGNCRKEILLNAAAVEEDYFVAPPGNIPVNLNSSRIKNHYSDANGMNGGSLPFSLTYSKVPLTQKMEDSSSPEETNPTRFSQTSIQKVPEKMEFASIQSEFPWGMEPVEEVRLYSDDIFHKLSSDEQSAWSNNVETLFLSQKRPKTTEEWFQFYDLMAVPFVVVLEPSMLNDSILGLRSRETTLQEILHRVFIPPFGMVKITFTNTCLMAVMILASRPLLYSDFVDHVMTKFVQSILTVPALVHHTRTISPQFFSTFEKEQLLSHVIAFLNHHRCQSDASPENADLFIDILNRNENNELLCFVGNFIELTDVYLSFVTEKNLNLSFMNALSFLLAQCKQYVLAHRSSNLTQWHPILGWFSQSGYDSSLHEAVPLIKKQLSLLWTKPFICLLLENSLRCYTNEAATTNDSEANSSSKLTGRNSSFGKKAWDLLADATNVNTRWIRKQSRMTNETKCMLQDAQHRLRIGCALYHTVVNTFVQLRLDVLTGKECNDELTDQLFNNLHRLLMVLYLRNCRRTYTTSPTHWIIKEIKSNTFFLDLERENKKALFLKEKMPHVISYQERVHLLKKNIHLEKCRLKEQLTQQNERHATSNFPLPVRLVKIRRNHIVEDAFHCLQRMSAAEMKHAFRVKFLNKEGLEEAGVDQAGIFKEFMVDLIKKLFDPSLNLFRRTSNGHVYPSPMSNVSETNHLDLIEFSGKMLAKAIYEGIVLDVRLASFFLSQILGQTQSTFYSYLDDLPSLDDELYRSLMYVKRYDGDVADLCLTFSTTEECFGTVLTRDLIPGGRVINVTNYNKIIYIHLMAHFRMHTQIKHQTVAFAKGFYSVLSRDFLSLFSVPELQLLISGEDEPLNFEQLRQHTQYYGGFHDSHKVIVWLWDILKNDFSEEERALFLKFVTSSSKPPVLGFAFLNPPFSIRCVEVGEDEDSGDSVGSVIRGFFTIRRKGPEHRLPTSSTCFNLLKLPNYSRKNVLRDKLRYAITANSGFELS
ncbi:hypothetical protein V9T40_006519 [Parthenolecanium corni]|uniref:Glutamyl-tRNA(Gln) amidotransferase subunit C, mitochondrial n=1 Tax=Parthenolecanium corni TaxID=536013 RepID=A0AAN9TZI1_9HEMI